MACRRPWGPHRIAVDPRATSPERRARPSRGSRGYRDEATRGGIRRMRRRPTGAGRHHRACRCARRSAEERLTGSRRGGGNPACLAGTRFSPPGDAVAPRPSSVPAGRGVPSPWEPEPGSTPTDRRPSPLGRPTSSPPLHPQPLSARGRVMATRRRAGEYVPARSGIRRSGFQERTRHSWYYYTMSVHLVVKSWGQVGSKTRINPVVVI